MNSGRLAEGRSAIGRLFSRDDRRLPTLPECL